MIKEEKSAHVTVAYHLENGDVEIDSGLADQVYSSWRECLLVIPTQFNEDPLERSCLRPPQISALYSILGHLTKENARDATVVMPTGTGKTETMLAAICSFPTRRSLIIVPTDSLRLQTFNKLVSLGKLRELGAIKEQTLNPVVALLKGGVLEEELSLVLKSNVIVTTPATLSTTDRAVQAVIYENCTHLFVDEAHHVKAYSWQLIKKAFHNKPVIQFTATPFRKDRNKVDGRIIFDYPMSHAQAKGYFRSINFVSVYEVSDLKGDIEVARKAVLKLREDIDNQLDHLLMARCKTKKRADEIFEIYKANYEDLNPVVIYSGVRGHTAKMAAILRKEHKIIICVDMLGEGFDLPELKICALHDIHKSLPITMQFAGRFVRDRPDLGDPTFVANVCDQDVEDTLKALYTEDPDWNNVLQRSSEYAIQKEVEFQELIETTTTEGLNIPLANLRPALSTLVYRAPSASLTLESLPLEHGEEVVSRIDSPDAGLIILVTKVKLHTKWAPQEDLSQVDWRIIIIYSLPEENLLFIHDSAKAGLRKRLAEKICENATLLRGDNVFRCFGRVERLVLQNAGLNRSNHGLLRYVMYTGTDLEEAINELAQQSSYKSNFFGKGYSVGEKVSIGCSHKGRIWSMNTAPVIDWMSWCKNIGIKLNDQSIDPNKILDKLLRTNVLEELPERHLIGIDWPDYCYEKHYYYFRIESGQLIYSLDEVELEIVSFDINSIVFSASTEDSRCEFAFSITAEGYSVELIGGTCPVIEYASSRMRLLNFFNEEGSPCFIYDDGTKLVDNLHIVRPEDFRIPMINSRNLLSNQWAVDITNESQGEERKQDSIQFAMIQKLKNVGYWIIFDDDGPNEVADIVAIKDEDGVLVIEFYHLKYSGGPPGSRVSDFYEVCGQVIKSCKWVGEFDSLIDRLKMREKKRIDSGKATRFEEGSFRDLEEIKPHANRLKKEYRFFIVQPGLDIQAVSDNVSYLLGSTDLYVFETTNVHLQVLGSSTSN